MRTCCILVAAGSGTRLGQGPKAALDVGGRPLLAWALEGLAAAGVNDVVVVLPQGMSLADVVGAVPAGVREVAGGTTRQGSVANGLALVPADAEVVLVHDAARCLTPPEAIRRVVEAVAAGSAAVIPGLTVTDTLRWADDTEHSAPARDRLVAVQTPQGFRRDVVVEAHRRAAADGVDATDDALLAERLGHRVSIVPGDERAFKVTRPLDLVLAQALVRDTSAETA